MKCCHIYAAKAIVTIQFMHYTVCSTHWHIQRVVVHRALLLNVLCGTWDYFYREKKCVIYSLFRIEWRHWRSRIQWLRSRSTSHFDIWVSSTKKRFAFAILFNELKINFDFRLYSEGIKINPRNRNDFHISGVCVFFARLIFMAAIKCTQNLRRYKIAHQFLLWELQ